MVVHRSDASGTTFIFSDYLSAVNDRWRTAPGKGRQWRGPSALLVRATKVSQAR
jgi:ABC-type phosphate transport system substrate-binding protein